ncbi:hypothetical protein RU639_012156 [Aspergillus parasiticus]
MDPSTTFDLPAGDYPAIDIQNGLGISILPSKRQPAYTPEACSCPPYPPQQHLYTPPTLQHYVLPDMSDMADLIPYTMERVHLREPPEVENNMFYTTPFRRAGDFSSASSTSTASSTQYSTCDSFDSTTNSTGHLHPNDYYQGGAEYMHTPSSISSSPYYPPDHNPTAYPSPTSATAAVVSASASSTRSLSTPPQGSANQKDLTNYGIQNADQTWRCAYPGCTSQTIFRRGCDLRKHYNRHRKHLFCRHRGCPQAVAGGFSSKKDRDRHEAKHNPVVCCEWAGCERVFSRVDNMKDHVRRIHRRRE